MTSTVLVRRRRRSLRTRRGRRPPGQYEIHDRCAGSAGGLVHQVLRVLAGAARGGGDDDELTAPDSMVTTAGSEGGGNDDAAASLEQDDPSNPVVGGYRVAGEPGTELEIEVIAVAAGAGPDTRPARRTVLKAVLDVRRFGHHHHHHHHRGRRGRGGDARGLLRPRRRPREPDARRRHRRPTRDPRGRGASRSPSHSRSVKAGAPSNGVGARYSIVAGQAAFRYSLMRPSQRVVRRTRRLGRATWSGLDVAEEQEVAAQGGGVDGEEVACDGGLGAQEVGPGQVACVGVIAPRFDR